MPSAPASPRKRPSREDELAPPSGAAIELAAAAESDASTIAAAASINQADVNILRGDGSSISAHSLMQRRQLITKKLPRDLRRFYKIQNDFIDMIVSDLEGGKEALESRRSLLGSVDDAEEVAVEDDVGVNASPAPVVHKIAPTNRMPLQVRLCIQLSFWLNVVLLIAKVLASISSGSISVVASAADSLLDLVSGAVLYATQRAMEHADPYQYPEGKSRLEPIGVVVFAAVMTMSSLQIIIEAIKRFVSIIQVGPTLELGAPTILTLVATIVSKLVAMVLCRRVARRFGSSAVDAYAQDHRNDVLTNSIGVVATLLAAWKPKQLGLLDPIGAVLIALWIMASWLGTAMGQIAKLTGLTAPPTFVRRLTHIIVEHDARVLKVDTCRAYHFGERFLVEVEIVMRPETTLADSHDVGIALQHKIERLEEVERAFVHVDYTVRDVDDHDPTTPLARKTLEEVANRGSTTSGGNTTTASGVTVSEVVAVSAI